VKRLLVGELPVPGEEYYWKRSDGWGWNGRERYWEIFVVFANGMNGGGGACITELWRWNGDPQNIREDPRNLTLVQTRELIQELWGVPIEDNQRQVVSRNALRREDLYARVAALSENYVCSTLYFGPFYRLEHWGDDHKNRMV